MAVNTDYPTALRQSTTWPEPSAPSDYAGLAQRSVQPDAAFISNEHAGVTLLRAKADDARAHVLTEAAACVLANRQADYGPPEDNFQRIAWIWSAWLWSRGLLPPGTFIETYDVAVMSSGIKDARICESPHKADNWVDRAGYTACGWQCAPKKP